MATKRNQQQVDQDRANTIATLVSPGHTNIEIEHIIGKLSLRPNNALIQRTINLLKELGHTDEEIRLIGKKHPSIYSISHDRLRYSYRVLIKEFFGSKRGALNTVIIYPQLLIPNP